MRAASFGNAVLCLVAALPWLYAHIWVHSTCKSGGHGVYGMEDDLLDAGDADVGLPEIPMHQFLAMPWQFQQHACAVALYRPLLFAATLFVWHIGVGLWVVSLLQWSTWLIDPYWTIAPILIQLWWCAHPLSGATMLFPHLLRPVQVFIDAATGAAAPHAPVPVHGYVGLAMFLVACVWSVRLTYNYFRREEWQFGAREDWRFAQQRAKLPAVLWAVYSLPYAYLSQCVLLVGVSLPLGHIVFSSAESISTAVPGATMRNILSLCAVLTMIAGVVLAHVADTSLAAYMAKGKKKPLILKTGVWAVSRHPNYVGEQMFHWGYALAAIAWGAPMHVATGTLINSIVLYAVTFMVEDKMRARKERRAAFEQYCKETAMWIPFVPGLK